MQRERGRLTKRTRDAAYALNLIVLVGATVLVSTFGIEPTAAVGGRWAAFALSVCVTSIVVLLAAGWSLTHPQVLTVGYVALATTVPAIAMFGLGASSSLPTMWGFVLPSQTPGLMALACLSFAVGTSIRMTGVRMPEYDHQRSPYRRLMVARIAIFVALALLVLLAIEERGRTYGAMQLEYGARSFVSVFASSLVIASTILLYASRRCLQMTPLEQKWDHLLVAAAAGASLAGGSRGVSIGILLAVLTISRMPSRRLAFVVPLTAVCALVVSSIVVNWRAGWTDEAGIWDRAIGDLSSTLGTTGLVAEFGKGTDTSGVGTLVAAAARLLPSPLANSLLGPPDDTGAFVFRRLIGFDDPNMGFGFSLPAEGLLSFGVFGVFLFMLVLGVSFAWSWNKCDIESLRPTALIYVVMVSSLPNGIRSDVLGAAKSVLYGFMLLWVLDKLADPTSRSERAARRLHQRGLSTRELDGRTVVRKSPDLDDCRVHPTTTSAPRVLDSVSSGQNSHDAS